MMKKLLLTAMAIATTIGAIAQVEPPVGAIDGRFSVATDKQVYFSQGNLQCTNPKDAATRTWAFAEHQYDRIGTANLKDLFDKSKTKVGVLFGSTIDLFGWSATTPPPPSVSAFRRMPLTMPATLWIGVPMPLPTVATSPTFGAHSHKQNGYICFQVEPTPIISTRGLR